MSRIRSKNTKPELIVRKFLFSNGYRYRLHSSKIPGNPDIVLPRYKAVIFVHGCFWHGHQECRYSVSPKSNQDYWVPKINRNKQRDLCSSVRIRDLGWQVITIWECELKPKTISTTFDSLLSQIEQLKHDYDSNRIG
jgi:DNA mismatch endonuclease (patch repair protein)